MARLCQHWGRVSRMDQPEAWLTRVALNLSASRYRRRSAEQRALARLPSTGGTQEDTHADALAVRDAVAALPNRQRTVLILRYFEDMSVSDTARIMDCAEGTVKSLTAKAMSSLRAHPERLPAAETTLSWIMGAER